MPDDEPTAEVASDGPEIVGPLHPEPQPPPDYDRLRAATSK